MNRLCSPWRCLTYGLMCAMCYCCGSSGTSSNAATPATVDVLVANDQQLRTAVAKLMPGTKLQLAPGEYEGGHFVKAVDGLTVQASDPKSPPTFRGGSYAWHFSGCSNLTIRHLKIIGQTTNGLNIDDGGSQTPATDIALEHISIGDIGPKGNHDGIKLSGLDRFSIRQCVLQGWGGQGIDMVGCHHGQIESCRLEGKAGFSATAGVQTKGGSADIVIEKCQFINAGERPLNVGGSTGLDYFRPKGAKFEAARITVRENHIEGSSCAVAFVGVDEATFSRNVILNPSKWIFRILQENSADGFVPCRKVKIVDNEIIFRRADVQIECNVGSGTQPESFEFRGNHWRATDRPSSSKPKLPVHETDGHY